MANTAQALELVAASDKCHALLDHLCCVFESQGATAFTEKCVRDVLGLCSRLVASESPQTHERAFRVLKDFVVGLVSRCKSVRDFVDSLPTEETSKHIHFLQRYNEKWSGRVHQLQEKVRIFSITN